MEEMLGGDVCSSLITSTLVLLPSSKADSCESQRRVGPPKALVDGKFLQKQAAPGICCVCLRVICLCSTMGNHQGNQDLENQRFFCILSNHLKQI